MFNKKYDVAMKVLDEEIEFAKSMFDKFNELYNKDIENGKNGRINFSLSMTWFDKHQALFDLKRRIMKEIDC